MKNRPASQMLCKLDLLYLIMHCTAFLLTLIPTRQTLPTICDSRESISTLVKAGSCCQRSTNRLQLQVLAMHLGFLFLVQLLHRQMSRKWLANGSRKQSSGSGQFKLSHFHTSIDSHASFYWKESRLCRELTPFKLVLFSFIFIVFTFMFFCTGNCTENCTEARC